MASTKSSLRVIRTQVQFELAEVAAKVAAAAAASARAQREFGIFERRCADTALQLRKTMNRTPIDLALLKALRSVYRNDYPALRDARQTLSAAEEREQAERDVLTDLRSRDRSLERATRAEQRRREAQRQIVEMAQADALWLQRAWVE